MLEQNGPAGRFYERLGGTPIAETHTGPIEVAYGRSDLRTLLSSGADWRLSAAP